MEINIIIIKLEIGLKYKEVLKKVLIVLSRGDESIYKIMYYFNKGKGFNIYVRLFRD